MIMRMMSTCCLFSEVGGDAGGVLSSLEDFVVMVREGGRLRGREGLECSFLSLSLKNSVRLVSSRME